MKSQDGDPAEGRSTKNDQMEKVKSDLASHYNKEMAPYLELIKANRERIIKLLHAAVEATQADVSSGDDILRAVVVFIHASLEDFLRTLAQTFLPNSSELTLNSIPLAGLSGRLEKFPLGKLIQHRGKSVDDVIRESVSQYLERSTFNNIEEITSLLSDLGFQVADHSEYFSKMSVMIKRRHQIVHRSDQIKSPDSDGYYVQPINPTEVREWILATQGFMASLTTEIFSKQNPPVILAKKLNITIIDDSET